MILYKKIINPMLFLYLFPVIIFSQSQRIRNAQAFSQHQVFGTIAVDEKGNPLTRGSQTNHFIYFESDEMPVPKISTVIYKGVMYIHPSLVSISQSQVRVGNRLSDNQPIFIKASKGKKLWKIELTPVDDNDKVRKNSQLIVIKGKIKKRSFRITLSNDVELAPMEGM